MRSLIYLFSKSVDLCFALHKLEKFSSSHGKVNFEGSVHLLIYIGDNRNLGIKYYAKMEDALLSELLRQPSIMLDNQLMVLYYSICNNITDTWRSIGAYIMFYKGVTIYLFTHVPGPFSQSSAQSEYNALCTTSFSLACFRMLNN